MITQKIKDKQEEEQYFREFKASFDSKFQVSSRTVYVEELGIYVTAIKEKSTFDGDYFRVANDIEAAWISGYSNCYADLRN